MCTVKVKKLLQNTRAETLRKTYLVKKYKSGYQHCRHAISIACKQYMLLFETLQSYDTEVVIWKWKHQKENIDTPQLFEQSNWIFFFDLFFKEN